MQGRRHGRTGSIHHGGGAGPIVHIAQARRHGGRDIEHIGLFRLVRQGKRHSLAEGRGGTGPDKHAHGGVVQRVAAVARVFQGTQGRAEKEPLLGINDARVARSHA